MPAGTVQTLFPGQHPGLRLSAPAAADRLARIATLEDTTGVVLPYSASSTDGVTITFLVDEGKLGADSPEKRSAWRGLVGLDPTNPRVIWGGCYGGAINRWDTRTDERRNVIVYPQLQLGQAAKDLKYRFQWVSPILVSRHDANVVYHGSQFVHRTLND